MSVACAAMRFQPRTSGRTWREKRSRTWSGSGFVSKVTVSQTMVVTIVVVNALFAKTSELLPVNGCQRFRMTVTSNEQAMAEISLQALIRHQYQRRMYTAPVPAPICSTTCHPDAMEPSCTDTHADTITSNTVHNREATT